MENIHETIQEAREELKRADHLLFVSLKYTRTSEVIKSIVERLSSTIGLLIEALLKKAEKDGKIEIIPASPGHRCESVKKLYSEEQVQEMANFCLSLRKILRSNTNSQSEYRRHVTLIVEMDDGELEINMPLIHAYYEKTKGYTVYVRELVGE